MEQFIVTVFLLHLKTHGSHTNGHIFDNLGQQGAICDKPEYENETK